MEFEQLSIFDFIDHPPELKIEKPIRLIELFAGIGAQAAALERLGANFEHYRVCEFDKYAIASYNAVHGTNFETSDIREIHASDLGIVNRESFTYLLTYSFPCTDLSVAGRMEGMSKGSGTRSGLLWEVERLLEECGADLPQILVMENVPQVHGAKNREDFDRWCEFLNGKGYTNAWQDMNAKNFGVAQSRNRCFMVSWLGNYIYEFPKPIPLKKRMKDYLEDSVDDKYYIRNEKAKKLIQKLIDTGTIPGNDLDRQTDRQTDRQLTSICQSRHELRSQALLCHGTITESVCTSKQEVELWSCGVDLTSGETSLVEIANSICARHDAGIVNHKNEHTGVIEWRITGAKS